MNTSANEKIQWVLAEIEEVRQMLFNVSGSAFLAGENCHKGDPKLIYDLVCNANNWLVSIADDVAALSTMHAQEVRTGEFCTMCKGETGWEKQNFHGEKELEPSWLDCPRCKGSGEEPVAPVTQEVSGEAVAIIKRSIDGKSGPVIWLQKVPPDDTKLFLAPPASLLAAAEQAAVVAFRGRCVDALESLAMQWDEIEGKRGERADTYRAAGDKLLNLPIDTSAFEEFGMRVAKASNNGVRQTEEELRAIVSQTIDKINAAGMKEGE